MRKNILLLFLVLIVCISCLVGCNSSDNNKDIDQTQSNNDNKTELPTGTTKPNGHLQDWRKIEILVDGNEITIPCTYKDFKNATGLSLTEFDEEETIEAGWYMPSNVLDKDENECLYIQLNNTSDKEACAKDCIVMEVGHYLNQIEDSNILVTFGGLQVGNKLLKQDVIQLFGEPDAIKEFRAEKEYQKEWETDSYIWYFNPDMPDKGDFIITVNIHTNLIEELQFSNAQ